MEHSKRQRYKCKEDFLKYCFLTIKNDKIVPDIENNELFIKTELFRRGCIATASNHAEGFHASLKKIADERKGFVYNISKLYDL